MPESAPTFRPADSLTETAGELSPFPATDVSVYELMGWLHVQPLTLDELTRIIRQEPALAAGLLRAAAEESDSEAESLAAAIVLLGISGLETLALSVPLLRAQHRPHHRILEQLSRSRCIAHIAECLAWDCGYPGTEVAYLAGLLLDLGRLRHLWRATQMGLAWTENEGEMQPEAAELGRLWRFPEALIAAFAYPSGSDAAPEHRLLLRLVALAAGFCADASMQSSSASAGSPLLRATQLVKHHLPLLSLPRQLAVAELLISEFKRHNPGRRMPSAGHENILAYE